MRFLPLLLFLSLGVAARGQDAVPTTSAADSAPPPAEPAAPPEPKEPPPKDIPEIAAKSAIIIDAEAGYVLYEKNADEHRPVASTQKLLTALIIAEKGELDAEVKVDKTDVKVDPTKVGLKAGKAYSRRSLLQALLVKSGNDAARALARDHAGGQEEFAKVMNRKARALGMGDSRFINANGLPAEEQFSTARDMAKLAFHAHHNEIIREAVAIKKLHFKHPDGWAQSLDNTNELLQDLPFVTGMKTGTTDLAGRCLVSSATYAGRTVLAIVLGSTDESVWSDSESLLRWSLRIPADYARRPPKPAKAAAKKKAAAPKKRR